MYGKFLSKELEVGVDKGSWRGNDNEIHNLLHEVKNLLVDDGLHDVAVDGGDVDGEEGSDDQEEGEEEQVSEFSGFP